MDATDDTRGGRRPPGIRHWSAIVESTAWISAGAMMMLALVPNATLFSTYSVGVVVSLMQALPLVLVRRWPITAIAVLCAGVITASVLASDVAFPWSAASILVGTIVIGTVSAKVSDRRAVWCLVAVVATAAIAPLRHHMPPGYYAAGAALATGFVLVIRLIAHLRETSTRLRAERQLRAVNEVRRDAEIQRSALTAQVHDIVGHHLAAISMTATSEEGRTSTAAEKNRALSEIASSAALALAEIRSVLDEASAHPRPAAETAPESLARLLAEWTDIGVQIDARGVSVIEMADPKLRHEAYLVTRQAITNVVQHGRTESVLLTVADEGDVLRLTIVNAADQGEFVLGRGLAGMRTRLEKNGHELVIRTGDGVFELDVTLVKEA